MDMHTCVHTVNGGLINVEYLTSIDIFDC